MDSWIVQFIMIFLGHLQFYRTATDLVKVLLLYLNFQYLNLELDS